MQVRANGVRWVGGSAGEQETETHDFEGDNSATVSDSLRQLLRCFRQRARSAEDRRDRRGSQRSVISGQIRQDIGLKSLDTAPNYVALFIGEIAVVFMHGPGEIITDANQFFDRRSHVLMFSPGAEKMLYLPLPAVVAIGAGTFEPYNPTAARRARSPHGGNSASAGYCMP